MDSGGRGGCSPPRYSLCVRCTHRNQLECDLGFSARYQLRLRIARHCRARGSRGTELKSRPAMDLVSQWRTLLGPSNRNRCESPSAYLTYFLASTMVSDRPAVRPPDIAIWSRPDATVRRSVLAHWTMNMVSSATFDSTLASGAWRIGSPSMMITSNRSLKQTRIGPIYGHGCAAGGPRSAVPAGSV